MSRFTHRCSVFVFLAGCLVAATQATAAGRLCDGTYATTAVRAWPRDAAVFFPVVETSGASRTRSLAFRSGLQDAGVKLDDSGSLQLQLLISIALPRKGAGLAGSGTAEHMELDWQPVETAFADHLKDPALQGAAVSLTAIVNNDADRRMVWLATMHCRIRTDDSEALARELGLRLGQALSPVSRGGQ